MSKVTLRTLQKDVLDAAEAVAIESSEYDAGIQGSMVEVTRLDLRLWRAALRLAEWKAKRRQRR